MSYRVGDIDGRNVLQGNAGCHTGVVVTHIG